MLRVKRQDLPTNLQNELNQAQAANMTWKDFGQTQTYHAIKNQLEAVFHQKCAYCESVPAHSEEHHWPKSPHPHNAQRGTTTRMFHWDNLLLACTTCNGFECKGSHMQWMPDGSPMLLNPCTEADDPLCYFVIALESASEFAIGWIDVKPGIDASAQKRAQYTIKRLKLNVRDYLVRNRAKNIRRFFELMYYLQEFGPDREAPSGHKLRDKFVDLLSARESFLAPIRQILYAQPEYAHLRQQILESMPELQSHLDSWALPSADCSHTV